MPNESHCCRRLYWLTAAPSPKSFYSSWYANAAMRNDKAHCHSRDNLASIGSKRWYHSSWTNGLPLETWRLDWLLYIKMYGSLNSFVGQIVVAIPFPSRPLYCDYFLPLCFCLKNNQSPLPLQTSTILLVNCVYSPFSLDVNHNLFRLLSHLSTALRGYR